MPYALFSNDAKLSKAYPTEADVWKLARRSGEIRPCHCEANEDPARNKADAEREARHEPELGLLGSVEIHLECMTAVAR
jgi:hypothetical protein